MEIVMEFEVDIIMQSLEGEASALLKGLGIKKCVIESDVLPSLEAVLRPKIGTTVKLVVFQLEYRGMNDEDVLAELARRNLVSSPWAHFELNRQQPDFSKKYPNCSVWRDAVGDICCLTFNNMHKPVVCLDFDRSGWSPYWWVCGVRQS